MNPIYPDVSRNDLYTRPEVEAFFGEVAKSQGGYVQAARLANLPYSLFTPLVNCLLGGILEVSDLEATPVLTPAAVGAMVEEAMIRHRMADYQDGDAAKLQHVYYGLGMHDFIPPYLASRNLPDVSARPMCARWEYFSRRRAYSSYSTEAEYSEEFAGLVLPDLPHRDEYGDGIRAAFPLDGMELFGSLPGAAAAGYSRAYGVLFSRYLPVLSDSSVDSLLISTPRLRSSFETGPSHASGLLSYYPCYRNTQDVLDEMVAMMADAPADGDTIEIGGSVHLRILSEISGADFAASPARALNRFILLTEAKRRIEGDADGADAAGMNILLEKLMQFVNLAVAVSELSIQRLRVEPLDY
jgi:hypothetical protein